MFRLIKGAMAAARWAVLTVSASLLVGAAPVVAQLLDEVEGAAVISRVNGSPLYAEHLEATLGEMHRGQEVQKRARFDLEQLMFRLVNDALLAEEARALDYDELPEIRGKVERRREGKARRRVYREEIVDRIDASDEKVRQIYDDVYRVATLRIASRRDRGEAEQLVPRVVAAADDESFAALAQEVSQDQYSLRGGRVETALTNLARGLYDFASTAAPGAVSKPLATPWGWTVARLVRLEPADPAKLAERRGRALVELRQRQEAVLRAALAERLQPELGLEIDWAVFDSVTVQRMHDGRLLPKFERPERVVAKLAGRNVTVESLAAKLASAWAGVANTTLAAEYGKGALDQLIFEQLLTAEGLRRGYGDTPAVRRELAAYEMNLLATRYLREVVGAGVAVTPEEARAYYEQHRDEFRKPPGLHLLQLTVATREEADRVAALARGGADFAWLSRQHSTDDFRERGGDRGWVAANEGTPLFRDELARAGAGEVLGPKEGPDGWAVLKVDLVEDRGHYPFEAVSGNVRSRIEGGKIVERIDLVIQRLRERAEIWIDHDALKALDIVPTAPEEESPMPGHDGG